MKKYFTFLLLACIGFTAAAQNLIPYTDTANHFSIGIPEGWLYKGSPQEPGIKMYAVRARAGKEDLLQENYNINIIPRANITLDITFNRLFKALSNSGDFNLVDSGSVTMNNKPFKWLIEKHKEKTPLGTEAELVNYDFIAYQNSKTYILTLVAPAATFEKLKPLLKKVAESFKMD